MFTLHLLLLLLWRCFALHKQRMRIIDNFDPSFASRGQGFQASQVTDVCQPSWQWCCPGRKCSTSGCSGLVNSDEILIDSCRECYSWSACKVFSWVFLCGQVKESEHCKLCRDIIGHAKRVSEHTPSCANAQITLH